MPEEIKKEPVVESPVDTRLDDALKVVKAQTGQLKQAAKEIERLEAQLSRVETELMKWVDAAAKKPVVAETNVVLLDGKSWVIKGTVKAKNALEEVKRGYIPEDASLVITDRTE